MMLVVYNKLLQLNYFPKDGKTGDLVFFKKQGKQAESHKSFRPIFGKIYKTKLILRRINHTQSITTIFQETNTALLPLKSTETPIQQSLTHVDINKSNGKYTSFISLDFMGVFDNLPLDLAIQSLHFLGISPQLINIIPSFLSNKQSSGGLVVTRYIVFF